MIVGGGGDGSGGEAGDNRGVGSDSNDRQAWSHSTTHAGFP